MFTPTLDSKYLQDLLLLSGCRCITHSNKFFTFANSVSNSAQILHLETQGEFIGSVLQEKTWGHPQLGGKILIQYTQEKRYRDNPAHFINVFIKVPSKTHDSL